MNCRERDIQSALGTLQIFSVQCNASFESIDAAWVFIESTNLQHAEKIFVDTCPNLTLRRITRHITKAGKRPFECVLGESVWGGRYICTRALTTIAGYRVIEIDIPR